MKNSIKKLTACSILFINTLLLPSQTIQQSSSNRGTLIVAAITTIIAVPALYRYATYHKDDEVCQSIQNSLQQIHVLAHNLQDNSENNVIQFFNSLCPEQSICDMNPRAIIREKKHQAEDLLTPDFLFRTWFNQNAKIQKQNIERKLTDIEKARTFAQRHDILVQGAQDVTDTQNLVITEVSIDRISSLPMLSSSHKLVEYANKLDRAMESIHRYRLLADKYPNLADRAIERSCQLYNLKKATLSLPEYTTEEGVFARQQAQALEQRRVAALENQAQAQRHRARAQEQQACAQAHQAQVNEQRIALQQEERNIQKYIDQHPNLTAAQAREQYHNRNDTINLLCGAGRLAVHVLGLHK